MKHVSQKTLLSVLVLFLSHSHISPTPPRHIPNSLKKEFTLSGKILVKQWYLNNSYPPSKPRIYTRKMIEEYIQQAKKKRTQYYKTTDSYLYQAIEKFPECVHGKKIGIIGSVKPWYESIALCYGGNPVTVEYNTIISEHPQLRTITVDDHAKDPEKFDAIFSISPIEHDGLGRYGDPINPNGDLEAMKKTKAMLKDDGLLFLAVPVGRDCLVWNTHRIYGKHRLPLLLEGWEMVAFFGKGKVESTFDNPLGQYYQPIFVLKKKR